MNCYRESANINEKPVLLIGRTGFFSKHWVRLEPYFLAIERLLALIILRFCMAILLFERTRAAVDILAVELMWRRAEVRRIMPLFIEFFIMRGRLL